MRACLDVSGVACGRAMEKTCYFVGIIDWYSRAILTYRISNSLDITFCLEAIREANPLFNGLRPEIYYYG